MPKLITLAIPTYNRAVELDRQLDWIFRNLGDFRSECEVLVSDNAATDSTPEVCERWQVRFSEHGVDFRLNRNAKNLGPLPNISRCIEFAASRFVWLIGDDDQIPEGKLKWVIEQLRANPDLASIVLNFEGTGRTVFEKSFHLEKDLTGDGQSVIEEIMKQSYNGLGFMTAQIYRTEFVQEALRVWPEGRTNYDYQIFVSAFAALQGRVLATRDTHLQYETGNNIYEKNPRIGMTISVDTLDVFIHLARAGYDKSLCRRLGFRHLYLIKRRLVRCSLRTNPVFTLVQGARAVGYLLQLARL